MGISGSSTVGQYRRDPGEGEVGCSRGRKTGAWALPLVFSCLRHPLTCADTRFIPVFDIYSVTPREKMPPWEQRLLWEGGPAPRGTGYPALQPHPSRMRKYWICFLKGKKKNPIFCLRCQTPRLVMAGKCCKSPFSPSAAEERPVFFEYSYFLSWFKPHRFAGGSGISLLTRV